LWYIQKNGRAEGPLPEATIAHAIRKGELGPYDLVFRDGESRWQVLSEIPEFKSYFQKKAKALKSEEEMWVVLVKNENKKERLQKGPFSTEHLQAMLKKGEVQLTDYVWKDGMKEWYRIHSLEVFHRGSLVAPDESTLTATVPSIPGHSEELLKSVQVMERPTLPPPDPVPLEATVVDFKKPAPNPTRTVSSKKRRKREDTAVTQVRRLTLLDRIRELPWPRKFVARFSLAGGVAILVLSVLYFLTFHDWQSLMAKKPTVKTPKAAVAVQPAAPPVLAQPTKTETVAPMAPAKPEPAVAPAHLKMRIAQGFVDLQTNASKHFSIQLRFIGEPGRVIGSKSYYRELRVKGIEERKVSLEKLGLPPGYYIIEAQVGDFEDRGKLTWQEKAFKQGYSEHRKSIAHFATLERYWFFKAAEFLEGRALELGEKVRNPPPQGISGYYRDWSRSLKKTPGNYIKIVSTRNRNDFVYAAEWLKLKELQKGLSEAGKTIIVAKDKNAPEATFNLRQIAGELGRQKEAALQASLWR
jgi:hypothetical protein